MFFPILACSIIRPHVPLNNHPLYNHQVLKPFQPNRQLIANPAEAIMVCFRGCSVPYGQPGWKSHLPAGFLVFQPFWWFISTWVLYMSCLWWNNCTQFPMFVTWNGIKHTIYNIYIYIIDYCVIYLNLVNSWLSYSWTSFHLPSSWESTFLFFKHSSRRLLNMSCRRWFNRVPPHQLSWVHGPLRPLDINGHHWINFLQF